MLYYVYIISYTFFFLFHARPRASRISIVISCENCLLEVSVPFFFHYFSLCARARVHLFLPPPPLSFPLGKCHLVIRVCQVYVCNRPFSICTYLFHRVYLAVSQAYACTYMCIACMCICVRVYIGLYARTRT